MTYFPLDCLPNGAALDKVTALPVEYKGRKALKVELTEAALKGVPGIDFTDAPTFVRIPIKLKNGIIEVDILGRLNGKGPETARAFIGLAYRITGGNKRFESTYLRPLNGRPMSPPPPRDKRAIQYFAFPDWSFDRLRAEYPDGRYEAGADIAADQWVRLTIHIGETRLRVSVDGKDELVIVETTAAPELGDIGLWVERGTEGYFANLNITPH